MFQISTINQKPLPDLKLFVGLCIFLLGLVFSVFSYPKLSTFSAIGIYLTTGLFCLFIGGIRSKFEYNAFFLSFSVCIFWFGISSIYYVYFNDPFQHSSDPANFYSIATADAAGLNLVNISLLSEGALAVFIWRSLYEIFSFIGFEKPMYIGILFNCLIVSLVSTVASRIVISIFGQDYRHLNFFILLFNTCAIFWLFATIHIRDSLILFLNTYLILRSVKFLLKPAINNGFFLGVSLIFATIIYPFLRTEFVFVPVSMALAIIAAYTVQLNSKLSRIRYLTLLTIAFIGIILVFSSQITIINVLIAGKEGYESEIGQAANTASSLGVALVVNQPTLLRIFIGTVYLHVFPIPFWHGFQLQSVYDLYKSFHVIYFWFVLPLFVLGAKNIFKFKKQQSSALILLFFLYLGFSIAIAISSLETRHLSVFAIPLLIISTIPDLNSSIIRNAYKLNFIFLLSTVFILHLAWAFLKFVI
jgi:hypothetical protein